MIVPVAAPFGEKLRDHRRFDNNTLGIGKVVRDSDPLANADKTRVIAPPRPQASRARTETTLLEAIRKRVRSKKGSIRAYSHFSTVSRQTTCPAARAVTFQVEGCHTGFEDHRSLPRPPCRLV